LGYGLLLQVPFTILLKALPVLQNPIVDDAAADNFYKTPRLPATYVSCSELKLRINQKSIRKFQFTHQKLNMYKCSKEEIQYMSERFQTFLFFHVALNKQFASLRWMPHCEQCIMMCSYKQTRAARFQADKIQNLVVRSRIAEFVLIIRKWSWTSDILAVTMDGGIKDIDTNLFIYAITKLAIFSISRILSMQFDTKLGHMMTNIWRRD